MITMNTHILQYSIIAFHHFRSMLCQRKFCDLNFWIKIILHTFCFYEIKTPQIFMPRSLLNMKLTQSTIFSLKVYCKHSFRFNYIPIQLVTCVSQITYLQLSCSDHMQYEQSLQSRFVQTSTISHSIHKINISDVRYEIFYILPITIIAHQIYHNMIIITICNSSSV